MTRLVRAIKAHATNAFRPLVVTGMLSVLGMGVTFVSWLLAPAEFWGNVFGVHTWLSQHPAWLVWIHVAISCAFLFLVFWSFGRTFMRLEDQQKEQIARAISIRTEAEALRTDMLERVERRVAELSCALVERDLLDRCQQIMIKESADFAEILKIPTKPIPFDRAEGRRSALTYLETQYAHSGRFRESLREVLVPLGVEDGRLTREPSDVAVRAKPAHELESNLPDDSGTRESFRKFVTWRASLRGEANAYYGHELEAWKAKVRRLKAHA